MTLRIDRRHPVVIATIDRPECLNALNIEVFQHLDTLIDEVAADRGVRALLIASTGEKAFSSGADINDLTGIDTKEASRRATWRRQVLHKLSKLDVPSVASIGGLAMGGGVELAISCTFRVATPQVTLSMPEIKLGLLPGAGATQKLARLVGLPLALEMMLTARRLSAEEALSVGLINRIVQDPLQGALDFAAEWTRFSGDALRGITRSARVGLELPIDEGLELEGATLAELHGGLDGLEGVAAFLEKRKPQFNKG